MNKYQNLTLASLKRIVHVREQLASLEVELAGLFVSEPPSPPTPIAATSRKTISAEGRARMAAAQKARWAKLNAEKAKQKKIKKKGNKKS